MKRHARHRVDGVLLLDKPGGLSSNAALQRVRRAFSAEKAGHTGTLDPLATGLLPIALGEATKFAHALLDALEAMDENARRARLLPFDVLVAGLARVVGQIDAAARFRNGVAQVREP
ncbi:MAG TPA: tRNA pseudouridine(55) synthase TruB, partial [Casimicrobiaceae bacterium]|nr:tRNA pseudouridine(55) synthase TruB [Casimicrobiaceae bacterium]